jgi:hypothetical protein
MAQERGSTPEKQLLRLLEGDGSKDASGKGSAAKKRKPSIFSLGAWKGRFFFLKDGFGRRVKGQVARQLDIKAVNKVLVLSIFMLIGYLAYTLSTSIYNMQELPNLATGAKEGFKATSFPEVSALKAISYYTEKVIERNIFKMGLTGVSTEVMEEDVIPVSETIMDLIQSLRLVGISWSDSPDAMIEDTESVRTFFVKRGQMIGKLKVQAIFKDKVVLSYEGAEVELK